MKTTTTEAMEVAATIMEQIGFWNAAEFGVAKRFAMTDERGGVALHLGGARETRGFRVSVVLTAADLYRVNVCKVRGFNVTNAAECDEVHAEDLAQTIGDLVFGRGRWTARAGRVERHAPIDLTNYEAVGG